MTFPSVLENITQNLSNKQAREVSPMTKANIHFWQRLKKSYCNFCWYMLKIYQRQTKSLEFPRDTNRKELKTKNMTSLCNGFTLRF